MTAPKVAEAPRRAAAPGAASGARELVYGRLCVDCRNRKSGGTCAEPVAAGLAQTFAIVWAAPMHAAGCPAFSPRPQDVPSPASVLAGGRPTRAPWWSAPGPDTSASWGDLRARLVMLGFDGVQAGQIAVALGGRDLRTDRRRSCLECARLSGRADTGWRCRSPRTALVGGQLPADLVLLRQRCPGFQAVDFRHQHAQAAHVAPAVAPDDRPVTPTAASIEALQ